MFVIMTDRHTKGGTFTDASGVLPPTAIIDWNNRGGLRMFFSDDESRELLVHTFEDAKKFDMRESAEEKAFVLCTMLPTLIGHIGVYDADEAGKLNTRETMEWMIAQEEMRNKMMEMKEECPS